MSRKKVFHIITRFDVGGAERVAINIASSPSADFEYHIVELIRAQTPFTNEIIRELKEKGIRYHRSFLPAFIHWHYLLEKTIALLFPIRMLWLWLRYRPDVVHTHTEMPDLALWCSLTLMPWMRFKVVRTIHNTRLWTGMGILGPRVERMMQRLNANVSIASDVSRHYESAYGELPEIIYNGVATPQQVTYPNLIEGKKNILFAGRLEEQKGITTLIEIIKVLQHNTDYHFHIFGSGTLQPLVDKQLKHLPNTSVNAPIHGLSQYMASFDYLLMPSLHEGLSILSIEASLSGLPVLINRCPGLIDTLPEEWPLSVSDNDIDQWSNLFNTILPTADVEALRTQSQEFARKYFSLSEMQHKYEDVYKSDIKGK